MIVLGEPFRIRVSMWTNNRHARDSLIELSSNLSCRRVRREKPVRIKCHDEPILMMSKRLNNWHGRGQATAHADRESVGVLYRFKEFGAMLGLEVFVHRPVGRLEEHLGDAIALGAR